MDELETDVWDCCGQSNSLYRNKRAAAKMQITIEKT